MSIKITTSADSTDASAMSINLDDLIRMEQAIRDYTIFQLEQPFKLIHRLEKMVKKTPHT